MLQIPWMLEPTANISKNKKADMKPEIFHEPQEMRQCLCAAIAQETICGLCCIGGWAGAVYTNTKL